MFVYNTEQYLNWISKVEQIKDIAKTSLKVSFPLSFFGDSL